MINLRLLPGKTSANVSLRGSYPRKQSCHFLSTAVAICTSLLKLGERDLRSQRPMVKLRVLWQGCCGLGSKKIVQPPARACFTPSQNHPKVHTFSLSNAYASNLIMSSSANYFLACHFPLTTVGPQVCSRSSRSVRKWTGRWKIATTDLTTNSSTTALEILSLSSLLHSILQTMPRRRQSISSSFWLYSLLFATQF